VLNPPLKQFLLAAESESHCCLLLKFEKKNLVSNIEQTANDAQSKYNRNTYPPTSTLELG